MISSGGIKSAATYYQNSMQAVKKNDSVAKAKEITNKDSICLLSPAAASYEYFKNFEERGKLLKEFVMKKFRIIKFQYILKVG